MMNEMLEYLHRVATDEFTYRFPTGWMMTMEEDPDAPRVGFHLQERKPGGQYGTVWFDRALLAQPTETVKTAVMIEFREIRRVFDDPKGQKRDREKLRNTQKNIAALSKGR